jgi:hypothetical protein
VTPPACDEHDCITCSDEGVPMTVVGSEADGLALCAAGHDAPTSVMTELVGPVGVGDVLLVHAGVALVRLEEATAA